MWSCEHIYHMIIWSPCWSYDHVIIWSNDHDVIVWSFDYDHVIMWSSDFHMITRSCDHTWSYDYMIAWACDHELKSAFVRKSKIGKNSNLMGCILKLLIANSYVVDSTSKSFAKRKHVFDAGKLSGLSIPYSIDPEHIRGSLANSKQ